LFWLTVLLMNRHSPDDVPQEVQALITEAKHGELDPMKFCAALEAHGIVGFEKLPYLLRAFNLKFEDAKEILIKFHRGSVEEWAEEMGEVVDQLSREHIGLDDG